MVKISWQCLFNSNRKTNAHSYFVGYSAPNCLIFLSPADQKLVVVSVGLQKCSQTELLPLYILDHACSLTHIHLYFVHTGGKREIPFQWEGIISNKLLTSKVA